MPASGNGIPNTVTATRTAVPAPAMAHQCGFTLSPANRPNSTRIGNAATKVERIQTYDPLHSWILSTLVTPPPKWKGSSCATGRTSGSRPWVTPGVWCGAYFTVNRTVSTTSGFKGTCFQSATTAITRWGPGFSESSTKSVWPRPRWIIPVTPRGIVSFAGVTSRSTNRWWCPVPGRSSVAGTISTPVALSVTFTGPVTLAALRGVVIFTVGLVVCAGAALDSSAAVPSASVSGVVQILTLTVPPEGLSGGGRHAAGQQARRGSCKGRLSGGAVKMASGAAS